MSETDVGMARLNDCAQLHHRVWCRLWHMGESTTGIVVDGQNFTPQLCEPTRNQTRTGAVTTINSHFQMTTPDLRNIKRVRERFDVMIYWIFGFDRRLNTVPTYFDKFALVIDIQQLFSLTRIQIETIGPHKLQSIPLGRIVPGSD